VLYKLLFAIFENFENFETKLYKVLTPTTMHNNRTTWGRGSRPEASGELRLDLDPWPPTTPASSGAWQAWPSGAKCQQSAQRSETCGFRPRISRIIGDMAENILNCFYCTRAEGARRARERRQQEVRGLWTDSATFCSLSMLMVPFTTCCPSRQLHLTAS
jgi:hypothetical protein